MAEYSAGQRITIRLDEWGAAAVNELLAHEHDGSENLTDLVLDSLDHRAQAVANRDLRRVAYGSAHWPVITRHNRDHPVRKYKPV